MVLKFYNGYILLLKFYNGYILLRNWFCYYRSYHCILHIERYSIANSLKYYTTKVS